MAEPIYNLKLTKEQAQIVARACEFYARIKIGQFQEIVWNCLDMTLPVDEFCERRDCAESALMEARSYIYPELYGEGHSYGLGKFEDADRAFDVHQVLRYKMGDSRTPWSEYDLPECVLEEKA